MPPASHAPGAAVPVAPTLADAQTHFYNARYKAAADLALELRSYQSADLANDELRSSALLFQLKALLEPPDERHTTSEKRDKERALKNCAECPALMTAFFADITHGQALARSMLQKNPRDEMALFYLGKLDLNFVWLQLGPLGRKTGWDEVLGGETLSRRRHQRPPTERPRTRRPRLDRLRRRHEDAMGDAMAAWGRQQEAGFARGAAGGRHRVGFLQPHGSGVRAVGPAGAGTTDGRGDGYWRSGSRRPFPTIGSSRCFWTARRPTSGADAVAGSTPARHRACWRRLARSTTEVPRRCRWSLNQLVGLASAASSSLPAPSGEATRRDFGTTCRSKTTIPAGTLGEAVLPARVHASDGTDPRPVARVTLHHSGCSRARSGRAKPRSPSISAKFRTTRSAYRSRR